jgi:hypothetical protein
MNASFFHHHNVWVEITSRKNEPVHDNLYKTYDGCKTTWSKAKKS